MQSSIVPANQQEKRKKNETVDYPLFYIDLTFNLQSRIYTYL